MLRFKGVAWQIAAFPGELAATLVFGRGAPRRPFVGILALPLPRHRARDAELPPDLPAGDYAATLLAECPACGIATGLRVDLRVIGESAQGG